MGNSLQVRDFGVIAGEDVVTGGHPRIGCDHTVIRSGNCDTRSTNNYNIKKIIIEK